MFVCLNNKKMFDIGWLIAVDELGKMIQFSECLSKFEPETSRNYV
jgi:hypothetical protein